MSEPISKTEKAFVFVCFICWGAAFFSTALDDLSVSCKSTIEVNKMNELRREAKAWINQNVFDGDDRSKAEKDKLVFSAPDFYELIEDLVEDLEQHNRG